MTETPPPLLFPVGISDSFNRLKQTKQLTLVDVSFCFFVWVCALLTRHHLLQCHHQSTQEILQTHVPQPRDAVLLHRPTIEQKEITVIGVLSGLTYKRG